jgi:hypothetical protein
MSFIYNLILKVLVFPIKIILYPFKFIWSKYVKRAQEIQIAIIYLTLFGLGGAIAYLNVKFFGGHLLELWSKSPDNDWLSYLYLFLMANVTLWFFAIGFLPYLFFERLMEKHNKYLDYWMHDNPDKME